MPGIIVDSNGGSRNLRRDQPEQVRRHPRRAVDVRDLRRRPTRTPSSTAACSGRPRRQHQRCRRRGHRHDEGVEEPDRRRGSSSATCSVRRRRRRWREPARCRCQDLVEVADEDPSLLRDLLEADRNRASPGRRPRSGRRSTQVITTEVAKAFQGSETVAAGPDRRSAPRLTASSSSPPPRVSSGAALSRCARASDIEQSPAPGARRRVPLPRAGLPSLRARDPLPDRPGLPDQPLQLVDRPGHGRATSVGLHNYNRAIHDPHLLARAREHRLLHGGDRAGADRARPRRRRAARRAACRPAALFRAVYLPARSSRAGSSSRCSSGTCSSPTAAWSTGSTRQPPPIGHNIDWLGAALDRDARRSASSGSGKGIGWAMVIFLGRAAGRSARAARSGRRRRREGLGAVPCGLASGDPSGRSPS